MTVALEAVVAAVRSRPGHRVLVAVDGVDAAGKTTFADALAALLPSAVRASVDDWHHPAAHRRRQGPLSPRGCYDDSFAVDALVTGLLSPFAAGAPEVVTGAHDLASDRSAFVEQAVPTRAVLVVDGVFLMRPALDPWWTVRCHLLVSEAEVLRRAVARDDGDPAEVEHRYRTRYLPAQDLYRTEADPEARADVVVDNEDPSHPVVRRAWTAAGRGMLPS